MDNMGKTTSETESGAKKVGTYDIPEDRTQPQSTLSPVVEPKRGLSWLWWLLGLLVLLALLAWAFNSFTGGPGPGPAATATPVAAVINMIARAGSAAVFA